MSSIVIAGDTSGAVTLQAPAVSGSTVINLPDSSGNLLNITSSGVFNIPGTGSRITGDFSNATLANRVLFQTSTTNGNTLIGAIPNGTATATNFTAYASSDPTNTSTVGMIMVGGSEGRFQSGLTGTGTYLPMTFYTSGTEQARIATNGNLSFNSGFGSAAVAYGCRAWVNFDGTSNATNLTGTYSQTGTTVTVTITGHGYVTGSSAALDFTTGTAVDGTYIVTVTDANTFTVTQASRTTSGNVTSFRNTIRASGNVSSITDNGTGNYTVNFTTAMPDANYGFSGMSGLQTTESTGNYLGGITTWDAATKTTTAFQFQTSRAQNSGSAGAIGPILINTAHISLQFFR
jgi:hypothetical protein